MSPKFCLAYSLILPFRILSFNFYRKPAQPVSFISFHHDFIKDGKCFSPSHKIKTKGSRPPPFLIWIQKMVWRRLQKSNLEHRIQPPTLRRLEICLALTPTDDSHDWTRYKSLWEAEDPQGCVYSSNQRSPSCLSKLDSHLIFLQGIPVPHLNTKHVPSSTSLIKSPPQISSSWT